MLIQLFFLLWFLERLFSSAFTHAPAASRCAHLPIHDHVALLSFAVVARIRRLETELTRFVPSLPGMFLYDPAAQEATCPLAEPLNKAQAYQPRNQVRHPTWYLVRLLRPEPSR